MYTTVPEPNTAETSVVRSVQQESLQETREHLEKFKVIKKTCHTYRLVPTLDEAGLIRVGGQLSKAQIGEKATGPLLLPNEHPVTKLIVRHTHIVFAGHMGCEQIIATVRRSYWIPQIRSVLDRIQWIFNPPNVPYSGGEWERQIRTMKKTIHAIIEEQKEITKKGNLRVGDVVLVAPWA